MAKIKYASFVAGLAGKSGSSVFFRSPSSGFGYMRTLVQPTYTTTNEARGEEMKNMAIQYHLLSTEAMNDFKTYASKYKNLPPIGGDLSARANNAMACMVLFFWNLKKANPAQIDLASIQFTDITVLYGILSIAEAVTAGYLPAVDGWEALTKEWPTT